MAPIKVKYSIDWGYGQIEKGEYYMNDYEQLEFDFDTKE